MIDAEDKYILQKAIDSGIINLDTLQVQIKEMDRKKYLDCHTGQIWKATNGYYTTWLKDDVTGERKLIRKKTRKEMDDFLSDYYKSLEFEPTLSRVFHMWSDEKLAYGEIQKQSYDRYISTYERFIKNSDLCYKKIKYIDEHMLEHFIKSTIHDNELTSKGWADLRLVLNGTFKYAKRNDYTDLSITQFMGDLALSRNIFRKRRIKDEEQVFTEDEVKKIYAYINDKIPTILELGILLAFQTGLRVGEIASLKYSDLSGDVLYVQRTEIKVKKDGHWTFEIGSSAKGKDNERKIVLTDKAIRTIQKAYMMNHNCEFLFSRNGKRIMSKQYTRCLYRICDKVGIPHRSMHKARKTYATTLLDAGVSPRIVMNQMGHTMIETTEAYYHFNNKQVGEIKEILTESLVI